MLWFLPYPEEEHKGRLIVGDPIAEACQWVLDYAEQAKVNVDDLWHNAHCSRVPKSIAIQLPSYMEWDPAFWDKFAIITGKQVSHNWNDRPNLIFKIVKNK